MSYQLERKAIRANKLAGFFNLMNMELHNCLKTRKIFMHLSLWAIFLFGLVVLAGKNEYTATGTMDLFLNFTGVFGAIGVILSVQNVIMGEKRNGVSTRLLSKPSSKVLYISIRSTQRFSFFINRGAAAGIPVGVLIVQRLLSSVLPKQVPYFPNSMLSGDEEVSSIIGSCFFNGTVSSNGSLISASILTLCFFTIVIWRFYREEL